MITLNRLAYTALTVLAVLFIWMMHRGCQNSRTRMADATRMQAINDSLKDRLHASQVAITNTRNTYESRMVATRQETAIAAHRADSAGKLLTSTQGRVKRLMNERIGIMEGPMDEDAVTANCDSCFAVLPVLDAQVTGYREENEQLKALTDYEIKIRDSAIATERRHSDTLQARATYLSRLIDMAPKPRNKIYFTITALTDLTGFGYGGGFTLVTKNDKIWSLKTGVLNRQLFYQVDAGFKLSARKK